ncbi:MAG: hypothetical protein ACI4RV_03060, partial [Eubacteriales bacterium]
MKKTLALVLALVMLVTMALPAGALQLDTVEAAAETPAAVPEETQEPAQAALAVTLQPGLNLATGTKDLATFDDEAQKDNFPYGNFASSAIVTDAFRLDMPEELVDSEGVYGNMLQFHREPVDNHWSDIFFNYTGYDGTRPYYFTWDNYFNMSGIQTIWGAITYIGGSSKHQNFGYAGNAWKHTAFSYTPVSGYRFQIRFRLGTVAAEDGACTNPANVYIDNFGIYPYYKISYVMPDDSTTDEYLLLDSEGAFVDTYTVKSDNYPAPFMKDGKLYTAIGWTTTRGSDAAVTSVALTDSDVALYPVYEVKEYLTGGGVAASTESATITAIEAVTWNIDVGHTGATVDTTETTATITGAGVNGAVTVSATLVSDPTTTVVTTVNFLGSKAWKPGLNLMTGTADAVNLDDYTDDEIYTYFFEFNASTSTVKLVDNPGANGVNYSTKVIRLNNTSYPSVWVRSFNGIEKERPIQISYSYRGAFDNHWVMVNGSNAGDIYQNMGASGRGFGSTSTWTTAKYYGKRGNSTTADMSRIAIEVGLTTSNSAHMLFVDDFSFIPAYKITYMSLDDPETVAYTDYALVDSTGELLTAYTPNMEYVPGATGFALTPDGEKVGIVPLANEDIVLYPLKNAPFSFTDGKSSVNVPFEAGAAFTFPTPDELDLITDNFRVWLDSNGTKYTAGATLTAAEAEALVGQTFTAYYQDATVPAMGWSYEGNVTAGLSLSKLKYGETIEDDGRSVLHVRQYASTWNGSGFMTDTRVDFKKVTPAGGFNADEYNIVSYMYKLPSAVGLQNSETKPEDVTPECYTYPTEVEAIIYYYTSNEGNGFYNPGGEHRVGNKVHKFPVDNEYHLLEVDMGVASNGNSQAPWQGTVYGLVVDPNRVAYAGDTYIDYMRVYRGGIFTVTYDTNAPEYYEESVVSEVAPDTGRGVGTGYLLKGERPVIDGQIFRGWALTPDATPE